MASAAKPLQPKAEVDAFGAALVSMASAAKPLQLIGPGGIKPGYKRSQWPLRPSRCSRLNASSPCISPGLNGLCGQAAAARPSLPALPPRWVSMASAAKPLQHPG